MLLDRLSTTYGLRILWNPRSHSLILGALLGIVLLYRLGQFVYFTTQIQWGYDFSAYWRAGLSVLEGASMYSPEQLAGPYAPQQQYLYLYPPALAVAVTPLSGAFDDYRAAAWVWTAGQAAITLVSVAALTLSHRLPRRDVVLLVGAAFAFPPIVGELVMGNVHLWLLGLLILAWLAIRRGTVRGEVVAGAAIGVASIIKVFPALLVLWFLATGRWRAAAAAVGTAALVLAVTLPVVGLQPWLDFPRVVTNIGPPVDTTDTLAPTVWLAPLIGTWPARILVTAIGVAIVAWSARRQSPAVSFSVAVLVSLLIAPALYHHYLAIAALPLLVAWITQASPVLVLAYLAMWGGNQPGLGDAAWVVNRLLPTLGALVLLIQLLASSRAPAVDSQPSVAAEAA